MIWESKTGEKLVYDRNGLTVPYTMHDIGGSTPEGGNMSWDVEFEHGGRTYRLENLSGWGESTVYVDGAEQDCPGYDLPLTDGVTVGDLENWLCQDYLEKLGVPEALRDAYWSIEAGDARWTDDGGFTDGAGDGDGDEDDESVRVTVEYVCDWRSDSGDDQRGHIKVTTPTGVIEATWSCRDGKGRGADLVSNTTEEFDDDAAEELVNSADLCQGDGTYEADLGEDEYGHPTLSNVVWRG